MKKKILVTGGSGFIGSNLIKKLLKNNYKVNSIDLSHDKTVKDKNFKFFKGDVFNENILSKSLKNCEIIIHLAASLGVQNTDNDIIQCLDNNINGTKKVLQAAKKAKIKHFISISSSEIYGDQKKFPLEENFNPQFKSIYGLSKIAGEQYVKGFYQKYNLNYNIIRFFNVYGSGQKNNFVISKFLKNAMEGRPLEVYGNGEQIRSFCHIEDATDGVISILNKGKKNETYNIGNDKEPISILKLALIIKKILKKKVHIKKIDFKKSDRNENREIFKRIPSIKKIKNNTNYDPQISLIDGIIKFIDNKKLIKKKFLSRFIGVGTLQFGLNYGVANRTGKISKNEVLKIKKIMDQNNIEIIDTAHAYGDSEKVLGNNNFNNKKLITKLPATKPGSNLNKWVMSSIYSSMKKLNTSKLYGMYIHNTKYLLSNSGPKIYKSLFEAKKLGLINKIGVSIYTQEELKKIISKYEIDLVLIPFNVFDQRMLKTNIFKELKEKNIEIHVRSSFLQGLLLLDKNSIPNKFSKYQKLFFSWEKLVKKLKLSKYKICLNYVLSNKYIDKVIVGVDNSKHLQSLISSADFLELPIKKIDASKNIELINPSKW